MKNSKISFNIVLGFPAIRGLNIYFAVFKFGHCKINWSTA